jgi:GMP synthase-like glutamine amidotransferase
LFDSIQVPFEYGFYTAVPGGQLPPLEAADAYLITGSPNGAYDPDLWIGELQAFIRRAYQEKKKLVGICFGHQVIAHSLGGRAEKAPNGWGLGLEQVELLEQRPWMDPPKDTVFLHFVHQDQVTKLPPGARRLAGSDRCPVIIFTIAGRVLGIQGHPEYSSELMGELLAYLDDHDLVSTGEAFKSLEQGRPDNQMVARWIANFLLAKSTGKIKNPFLNHGNLFPLLLVTSLAGLIA